MIKMQQPQHTATSPARKLPMAAQEILAVAAYRAVAPIGVRLQGTTLPTAEFGQSRIPEGPMRLLTVGDRNWVATVPGAAARGRPV
jgi:hypothetical protein